MSMDHPQVSVSVVVVNYQGASYLKRCLDRVASQDLVPDEILVVDNASSDGSDQIAARYGGPVRLIEAGGNLGPAGARNLGLEAARNRWVLCLDNDCYLETETLGQLVRAATTDPAVVLVQPRSLFATDPSRVHYDGGTLHHAGLFSLRNWYRPLEEALAGDHGPLQPVDGAVSLCLLVDRDRIQALGAFDPVYFILFEDLDLSYRVRSAGLKILSVPGASVLHDEGTAGVSFRSGARYPAQRFFLHARNRPLYLLKNYSLRALFLTLPSQAIYEFAYLALALRHRGFLSWMRGKAAAVALVPQTLSKRAVVQAARVVGDGKLLVEGPLTLTPDAGGKRGTARWLSWALGRLFRLVRPLLG